jgi:outer membrane murein-binding lipoprotein Lpp
MKFTKSTLIASSVIVSAALMSGCSSDDTDKSNIRIIHASADAPAVDIKLNDAVAAPGLDYPQSTGFVSINAGT